MRRLLLYLPILCSSVGCASWKMRTVTPNELPADAQAHAPAKIRSLQLATLGSPVLPEYQIQPGDLLEVTISDLVGENQFYPLPVRVLDDGTIRLPLVGPVAVKGLSFPEAEQVIFASYSSQGLLRKPLVTVALRDTRKVRVYVLGAVLKPGQYDLNVIDSDLLSALVAAGGLTSDAGTVIEIRRRVMGGSAPPAGRQLEPTVVPTSYVPGQTEPNLAALYFATQSRSSSPYSPIPSAREMPPAVIQEAAANMPARPPAQDQNVPGNLFSETGSSAGTGQLVRLDLTNEKAKQELAQGFHLKNGDTITIEDRKLRPIYVVGMVNKPGEYTLPVDRDIRLLEAIGLAGGVDRSSLPSRVLVIRQRPDGSGVLTVRIDLNKAKVDNAENMRLMPGDTISVEETVGSYMRSLLRGAVRFGVGATVSPAYGF